MTAQERREVSRMSATAWLVIGIALIATAAGILTTAIVLLHKWKKQFKSEE